ncbi:hypothetical protein [Amycolatopsis sp. NPDC004625]|uniref:hypothetical protein n=1 Tax=Amycolatopsis sp. NPDC004625 TaxID=3154670 RepID=UPI0033B058BF
MSEQEAWEAGRAFWKMNPEKVTRQRFALIVAEGVVRAVVEITGHTRHDDRLALDGTVLEPGHPLYDYVGKPDPVETGSQNPVGYTELPEEAQFLYRPCGCGCGETTDRDFLPGHDVRAMQDRVRTYFGASPLRFIEWVDSKITEDAHAGGNSRWPGLLTPELFHDSGTLNPGARLKVITRTPAAPTDATTIASAGTGSSPAGLAE